MEDVFDLKEFICSILHRWRVLVVCILIFGLFCCSLKVISGVQKLQDPNYMQEQQKLYQDQQAAYQQQKDSLERQIVNTENSLAYTQDYNENSLMMKIDPYDQAVCSSIYYVTSDRAPASMELYLLDHSDQIATLYNLYLTGDAFYEAMQQDLAPGNDAVYLKELVSVSMSNGASITVTVVGDRPAFVAEMMDYIDNRLNEYSAVIGRVSSGYSLHQLQRSEYSTVNLSLRDTQIANNNKIADLSVTLADKTKALEELKEPENQAPSKRGVLIGGIKYGVLGGVIGLMVGGLLVITLNVFDTRIRYALEPKRNLDLRYLGSITQGE